MKYVKLANSNVEVSEIIFGAWAIGGWMWGGADVNDAIKAIDFAIDNGINTIDTAPIYGFGASESLVGKAIKGKRDKVVILTKYGLRWDSGKGKFYFTSKDNDGKSKIIHKYAGKESIIKECEESLKRLGVDYIDLYQLHWPDVTTPIEESMEAAAQLLKEGKIRAAGVSNYSAEQMKVADSVVKLSSNQAPFSMIARDIEKDVVPYCLENNRSILAYSPLQRGFLTGKIRPDHKFNEGDHRASAPYFEPGNLDKINKFLDEIKPIADEHNATLSQLVIRWTLDQPGITAALVGARTPEQVSDNMKAVNLSISQEEIETINNKLKQLNNNLIL